MFLQPHWIWNWIEWPIPINITFSRLRQNFVSCILEIPINLSETLQEQVYHKCRTVNEPFALFFVCLLLICKMFLYIKMHAAYYDHFYYITNFEKQQCNVVYTIINNNDNKINNFTVVKQLQITLNNAI